MKVQMIAQASTKDIICFNIAHGHKHDFRIFKKNDYTDFYLKSTQSCEKPSVIEANFGHFYPLEED